LWATRETDSARETPIGFGRRRKQRITARTAIVPNRTGPSGAGAFVVEEIVSV
jgi:hypothetical protein